ncbi:MAG TPA: TylF/MycF/NovP-related O-methyltransferase [Solirubrobacteraceae bacterium]|nr:TylF/MycF/NovP-related O-methyltransferase [Solirubrobacteraceae bacterium]
MAFPDLTALREFAGWKAARAPHAAGPGPNTHDLRAAYLDVLKLALCDLAGPSTASVSRLLDGALASRELAGEDRQLRAAGLDWPLHGLTMVGLNRLDDLQACVESVVADGVEGDLIEAGAWRGGASILMRATLDALGASERTVHVADSFQGFPAADELQELNANDFLAVPVEEVRESFARFGLERGVRFHAGFFEQTLPGLAGRRWAVIRLDADTYEATRTALEALYPGLAAGGYLIVDDYGVMDRHECRRAVDEFRARHGIEDALEPVDWTCVRWRRTDEAAVEPAAEPPPAPERAVALPRPGAPRVPTGRELELEREVAALREQVRERPWRRRPAR